MRSSALSLLVCALLVCGLGQVFGRKCVCTSKACKENGVKTCKTRFSCYTELIYSGDAKAPGTTAKTTRGCTEGATPLLCETKSWHSSDEAIPNSLNPLELLGRVSWPRLTCCDSHDYCNAADEDFEPTSAQRAADASPSARDAGNSSSSSEPEGLEAPRDERERPARIDAVGSSAGSNIQQLHVAALVLAVAALISVFAACYVVTRFLNANRDAETAAGHRMIGSSLGDRLDF